MSRSRTRSPLTRSFAAFLVSVSLSTVAEGQSGATVAAVAGRVTDKAGVVIAGVDVELSSAAAFVATSKTDESGEFEIGVPSVGDYTLEVRKEGYLPLEADVTLSSGETMAVEITLLTQPTSARSDALESYRRGAEAYETENYAVAKQYLLAATTFDPTLPEPFLVLADLYFIEGDYERAASSAAAFLAANPGDQKALVIAYEANKLLGNEDVLESLRSALAATDVAPKMAIQTYNEGALADQRGDTDIAIQSFRAAATLDPELVAAHMGLATVLLRAERYVEAATALERVLELDGDQAPAHLLLGKILFSTDRAKAEQHLMRFIALAPDDPNVASVEQMLDNQ